MNTEVKDYYFYESIECSGTYRLHSPLFSFGTSNRLARAWTEFRNRTKRKLSHRCIEEQKCFRLEGTKDQRCAFPNQMYCVLISANIAQNNSGL
jgi:hypothetical protein